MFSTRRRCRKVLAALLTACACIATNAATAESPPRPVRLAIDAEFGVRASTSAQAIETGARIAASEINSAGGVLGRPLEILTRNNNSVPARAAENLRQLAANPDVVAVMGGKHSPVVLNLLPLIHRLGIPYLAPWSAADGITTHPYRPGFVFRLSLRDSWALKLMIDTAIAEGVHRLAVVLPNSAWGRSSLAAIQARLLQENRISVVSRHWYSFGESDFERRIDAIHAHDAEMVILVANELEGAAFTRAMANRPRDQHLPVLSHWGITGGEFHQLANGYLGLIDLRVVQTYSFVGATDARARAVLAMLAADHGIDDERAISSPVGLAHAYDLTHLLARAIESAGTTERSAVRDALAAIDQHAGLVRHYRQPFSTDDFDALDASQLFLARYAADGALVADR